VFCSRCGQSVTEGSRFCPSCGLDLAATTPGRRVTEQPTGEKSEAELVGEALAGEYELIGELGRGGMAIVYHGRDKQLEREVAIKVLPFSLAFDAEFVERFQREARTAARLEHPNIIPIYRVGRSGRVIYFVMKLLRGQSLSRVLAQRTLAPVEIQQLLVQTAGALGFAHRHGIVHRDVKPDNIMFDELGHAVVTDFGIAKAASGTRLTGTGMSIGTPHYMSPEQARAQPLDGRSDLYSLGVVAYECLTGRKPFDGEDAFAIGYKHIMEKLPEPPLESPDARRVFAVIRRMMEKAPADRYQTAEDLVRELEGRRPSVTVLEMEAPKLTAPDAAATLALTREEAAQIASGGRPAAGAPVTSPLPGRRPSAPAEAPATPDTPMPRRPAVRPPRQRKKSSGALVAAAVVFLVGAGGAGGYVLYTRYLRAQPAAAPEATSPPSELVGVTLPPVDSALLAARDSVARADAERFRALPDSGWLVVTGVPTGARLYLGEQTYRDTMLWLGIGTYKVRVSAAGYTDFDGTASVPKADTAVLRVAMTRASASASPSGTRPATRQPATATRTPARQPTGQCDDPRAQTYNLNFVCWDQAPSLVGSSFITVPPGTVTSARPVTVLVHVGSDGKAIDAFPVGRQGEDLAFLQQARRYARAAEYEPARKNGQPVESFFPFRFAPQVRQ
jgi:serine/threonine-protein kinase